MLFADPRANAIGYLILRHLYDGDVIDWPVPDEHPQRDVFATLEASGFIARWDRTWPLHDRYRLTEQGIAAIEAVYRPAGADAFFADLRRRDLPPAERRAFLQAHGLDPALWPVLHDPSAHWSTLDTIAAPYQAYVWEDSRPMKRRRRDGAKGPSRSGPAHPRRPVGPKLVDLDREPLPELVGPYTPDYDVS
jgi:hypothetical protein